MRNQFTQSKFQGRGKPILLRLLLLVFLVLPTSSSLWGADLLQFKSVTVNVTDVSLVDALLAIKEQAKCELFYISSDIDRAKRVSVQINDGSVEEALTLVLKGSDLKFSFKDNAIVISKSKESNPVTQTPQPKRSVLSMTVIDKTSKEPIAGAVIIVASTGAGAITDEKGKFLLVVDAGLSYEISCLGYKSFKGVAQRDNPSVIELEHDAFIHEDVVITGYQTVNKRLSASSVTTVRREDIEVLGANSIDQMLQGKIAGMSVINTSGEPSATPKIRIRGNSTLNGNKAPVWVLDGVILEQAVPFNASNINSDDAAYLIGNAISGINPQDIETITVLKDASATAIYGVKAANGVIVITTRKGNVGAPVLSYSGSTNIKQRPSYNNFDLMNSAERVQLSKEIVDSGVPYSAIPHGDSYEGALHALYTKEITQQQFDKLVIDMQERNTDWYKHLFVTEISQSHSMNLSGGTEKVNYYFSAGYTSNGGGAIGSNSKNLSTLAKVSVKLNERIDFSTQIRYNNTKNLGYNGVNVSDYAHSTSRTVPAYDENGERYFYSINSAYSSLYSPQYNIFNELDETGKTTIQDAFGAILNLNVKLIKGLKYTGTFSYDSNNSVDRTWATDQSYQVSNIRGYSFNAVPAGTSEYNDSPLPYGGILSVGNTRSNNYTVRNAIEYGLNIDRHEISAMGGIEARSNKYIGSGIYGYGWVPEFGDRFNPARTEEYIDKEANGDFLPSLTNSVTQIASVFGVFSYALDGKYIFNANIRSDGANKFGSNPKYRWLPTWSVAGKWILSSEDFMKNIHWVNHLSARTSYGVQGNIHDDSSPYLIVQVGERDHDIGHDSYTIERLPNPDLRWEKTTSWNAAVDFTLLNGRIRGSYDMYNKYTEDLILNKYVATSNGRSVVSINGGEMRNYGFEGVITAELVKRENFGFRLGLVFSNNINEITLANGVNPANNSDLMSMLTGNLALEGDPVGTLYSYKYMGLSAENGFPLFEAADGNLVHGGEPSYMEFVNSGSIYPDLSGGINLSFTLFKNLIVSTHFTYSVGGVGRLPSYYQSNSVFDPLENVSVEVQNRWKKPGDELTAGIHPAIYDKDIVGEFVRDGLIASEEGSLDIDYFTTLYNNSTAQIVSTDFLRLSSLSMQYTVPKSFTDKLNIGSATVRFEATNLAVWASKDWNGLDPETANASIPLLPTYNIGLNISF